MVEVWAAAAAAQASSTEQLPSYYFPGPPLCTVMVDFAPSHAAIDALAKEQREASLASRMLHEISVNIARCGGSTEIRALAVEIPGTDNYGRPNFGARKNLLMIEGPATAVLARGSPAAAAGLDELKAEFKITEY